MNAIRPAVFDDIPACLVLLSRTRENATSAERLAAMGITAQSWADDLRSGGSDGATAKSLFAAGAAYLPWLGLKALSCCAARLSGWLDCHPRARAWLKVGVGVFHRPGAALP